MIDLDQMPPDWKFAENHAKAVRPGISESLQSKKGNSVYCRCCLKPVEKLSIPLTSNSKQLEFLGLGFPLYFIYLKYSIILVLLLICSYSGVSLYWAIQNNQAICQHRLLSSSSQGDMHCTSFLIIFSRIQTTLRNDEIILRIASFVIHLFFLIYIRDNIRKTHQYYDQHTTTLSDYSIFIKKLPLKDGIQQNIRDFINQYFQKDWQKFQENFDHEHFKVSIEKIKQIILVPDFKEYYQLQEEKKTFIEEKRKILIDYQKGSQPITHRTTQMLNIQTPLQSVNQKLRKINLKIQKVKSEYRQKAIQDKLQTQMAIVVLNTEAFKNTIISHVEDSSTALDKQLLGKYFGQFEDEIEIEEAPGPNEIIWHNLHYSGKQVIVQKLIGWMLSILFIAIVTVVFYFILVAKTKILLNAIQIEMTPEDLHKSGEYKTAVFLVFLLIFLIVLFNKLVLGTMLHHFTHLEKHQRTSHQEFSFALKYTLGLFFTTALMTLAVEAITYHNFYSHQYGVIEQESIMYFVNAFFVPLVMLVNPFQLKILITRMINKGKKHFTQKQANTIMSDYPYAMGKQYAQIIQTLWFTFLYSTMIPLGAFITVIGLSLYYWASKYNMLRRSSLEHNISGEMTLLSLKLLDMTLIMKPIGELIFDSSIRDGVSAESIVLVCVGFAYLIIPIDRMLEYFHEEEFKQQEQTYDEVKHTFLQTYQTLHPIMNHLAAEILNSVQTYTNRKIKLTRFEIPQLVSNRDNQREAGSNVLLQSYKSSSIMNKQQRQLGIQKIIPVMNTKKNSRNVARKTLK